RRVLFRSVQQGPRAAVGGVPAHRRRADPDSAQSDGPLMNGQRGQAMAEYLVALGIGGTLVAALTLAPCTPAGSDKGCVPTLLDALHNNYAGYSAAIADVQHYGDLKVAAPPADEGGVEDDDSIPG